MNLIYTKNFATQLALLSFALGTILFLSFCVLPDNGRLLVLCLGYIVLAAVINSLMLAWLIYNFLVFKAERQELAIRILLLLSNIPIAIIYFFIILQFSL